MAAIAGLNGSIAFASGYTNIVNGWSANLSADQQDITPLSPAGNHQVLLTTGLLNRASGSYRGKLTVSTAAALSGSSYGAPVNPEAWMFEERCEARDITPLGAAWATFIAGLKTGRCDMTQYLDDTTALPTAGSAGTALLTCDVGAYTVPFIVEGVDDGVDVTDTERRAIIHAAAASACSCTGGLPLAGVQGSATFLAVTGRTYTGTILITRVMARINRRTSEGSYDVDWVANGALVAA